MRRIKAIRPFKHDLMSMKGTQLEQDMKSFAKRPTSLAFSKPRFSYRDVVIALVLIKIILFLINHLQIHWK